MLVVYKNIIGTVYNPEKYFNEQFSSMNLESKLSSDILTVMERAKMIGRREILTPFGEGDVTELKVSTKLALCLSERPALTFECTGMSEGDLRKILVIPQGHIVLKLDKPFTYMFDVRVRSGEHVFRYSTDINLWYFGRR